MVESKKVFKRTNWVCWDVEWQKIALCDGQFEYFDQKNQKKLTIQGFCPKKIQFLGQLFHIQTFKTALKTHHYMCNNFVSSKRALNLFLFGGNEPRRAKSAQN